MISKDQIEELFQLYSKFHGAIDPFAPDVLKAEEKFLRTAAFAAFHACG